MTKQEATARERIRQWLSGAMKSRRSFKLPRLVNEAVRELAADHGFLRLFAEQMLRSAVYEVAVAEMSQARGPISLNVLPVKVQPVGASVWERWEQHFEHAGDTYVRLPDLTKAMGTVAIAERRVRMDAEQRNIEFLSRLIAPLGKAQKVRDCWKPQDVTALYEALHPQTEAA